MAIHLINVSDLVNPDTGKTYRQENEEKIHNIPLKTLVEVDFDDEYSESPKNGLRLFVVSHDRDCDGTPLYSLSFDQNWSEDMYGQGRFKAMARAARDNGYSEDCLKVIKPVQDLFPTSEEIKEYSKKFDNTFSSMAESKWVPYGFIEGANWVIEQIKSKTP